jgi:hypothetical protein
LDGDIFSSYTIESICSVSVACHNVAIFSPVPVIFRKKLAIESIGRFCVLSGGFESMYGPIRIYLETYVCPNRNIFQNHKVLKTMATHMTDIETKVLLIIRMNLISVLHRS